MGALAGADFPHAGGHAWQSRPESASLRRAAVANRNSARSHAGRFASVRRTLANALSSVSQSQFRVDLHTDVAKQANPSEKRRRRCKHMTTQRRRIVVLLLASVAQLVLALSVNAAGWSPATSLADGRTLSASVLLPNGRLLVAGGFSNTNATLASAFLYDYVTDTWSSASTMSTPRESPTATLLLSGKVLIAGGFEPIQQFLSSAELYDPATNSWSSASSMSVTRSGHTATLLPNGKVCW